MSKGKRFEVDDEGFKTQMSEMPLWRLIQEAVSNSFDEDSVDNVIVKVKRIDDDHVSVSCLDDGRGFRDPKEIYTLYKDSYKRVNSKQRGRYNLGDKQFFAVAKTGSVKTNENHVIFDENGRKERKLRKPQEGVLIEAIFETKESVEFTVEQLKKVAVPELIEYKLNNEIIEQKEIIHTFPATLRTPIAKGRNQKLVEILQECEVRLYELKEDEKPLLMELGVPVNTFEQKIQWHVDVRQKVPIPTSRDMVSDAYLQKLYAQVLDNTLDLISEQNVGNNWIKDGMKNASEESNRKVLQKTYGTDKVMIESSTDPRANEKAQEAGFVLVKSGTFDGDVMDNISKSQEIVKYAGKEFATTFGDWEPVEPNADMIKFAEIVKRIGKYITGKEINVEYFKMPNGADMANWGGNTMSFNISYLGGMKGFSKMTPKLLGIIIHELAHAIDPNNPNCSQYSHLKMDFIRSMETVASKIGMKGIDYFLKEEVVAK